VPVVACTALKGGHAVRRSALIRTLDAGLGAWLRGVDIEPKMERGRFQGWLIQAIYAGDPCWSEIDLRAGDIVARVNRRRIHSPDEAQAVWTALRGTREIVVDFVREGKPRTLRFPVVDDRE
jgi:S1-C subfamily serine protease